MKKIKKDREREVLVCVTTLPQHMIELHGLENMTEFLLHKLASQGCFNFKKAAYFIDNPDFDHLKGVAGFTKDHKVDVDHWTHPNEFSSCMKQSEFNQKVRTLERKSAHLKKHGAQQAVIDLAQELGMYDPSFVHWNIKYDNVGLLLFEPLDDHESTAHKEHLYHALHLLGFCPIF